MLAVGKLPPELLARLLNSLELTDPSIVIGPTIGEDATVIDMGDQYLVAKTDPVTFTTDAIGWYVVCVNSNDIATMGAVPRWLLATVLLPEGCSHELVEDIFEQLRKACRQFRIVLCGGHTEITYQLDRPIIVGLMLGTVAKESLITSAGARIGDDLLLTKGLAIEATSIIARERACELTEKYDDAWIECAQQFLYQPGISVLAEARIACEVGGVHAMHDPTEGGVATAVHELARCSQTGALIWEESLFLYPETRCLCDDYGLDPLGTISSGALLLAVDPNKTSEMIGALTTHHIPCERVGKVTASEEGVLIQRHQHLEDLPLFVSDEITKLF